MKYKHLHIFNGTIFIILLTINLFIYKNRDDGYAYKEFLNYNQLYQNKESLSIHKLSFNGTDSLKLTFAPNNYNSVKWQIKLPHSLSYISNNNPVLKLYEGAHNYTIKNLETKDSLIKLRLNFITENTYKKNGRSRNSDVELMYASIPFKPEKSYSSSHWIQSSEYTTEKEITIAKKTLMDSIHVNSSDNDITKIQKIGSYILKKLDSKRGTPKDTMELLSPLQRFDYAHKNKSEIWCGDFSSIFSFFTNTAGIATRSVWLEGHANGILTAGHSFNESYIKELNQWIFIDLTSNTLSIQTNKGKYLNTIDFYNAYQLSTDNLVVTSFNNDSIYKTTIKYSNSFYNDYFNPNVNFTYYYSSQFNKHLYNFSEKIKRYALKNPTFASYSNAPDMTNFKFYLKQGALLVLFLFTIYWIMLSLILKNYIKK